MTLGFTKLSEKAVVHAWSSDVGKLAFFSPSSSSSLSTTPTISFAGFFFFFFLFSLGLEFVLPGPHQLLSNTFRSTCISSFEPELSLACVFPLPDGQRSRVQGRCFTWA